MPKTLMDIQDLLPDVIRAMNDLQTEFTYENMVNLLNKLEKIPDIHLLHQRDILATLRCFTDLLAGDITVEKLEKTLYISDEDLKRALDRLISCINVGTSEAILVKALKSAIYLLKYSILSLLQSDKIIIKIKFGIIPGCPKTIVKCKLRELKKYAQKLPGTCTFELILLLLKQVDSPPVCKTAKEELVTVVESLRDVYPFDKDDGFTKKKLEYAKNHVSDSSIQDSLKDLLDKKFPASAGIAVTSSIWHFLEKSICQLFDSSPVYLKRGIVDNLIDVVVVDTTAFLDKVVRMTKELSNFGYELSSIVERFQLLVSANNNNNLNFILDVLALDYHKRQMKEKKSTKIDYYKDTRYFKRVHSELDGKAFEPLITTAIIIVEKIRIRGAFIMFF
ncbi:hypothetical protein MHBO_000152 [Bonamia ostreae]|uniref:Uncharacterized protein n=1 Tax=Bonamia ostreae TaxID=126728 RepID=A0ABV2AEK0_9EUKA